MDDQRRFEELEERVGKLEEAVESIEEENEYLRFRITYTNTAISFLLNFYLGLFTKALNSEEKKHFKLLVANALNVYANELNKSLGVIGTNGKPTRMDSEERRKFIDGMIGFIEQIMNTL